MKVNLKIASPKTKPYKVKGKDYTEAANFLINKPFSACYEANPSYKHKFNNEGQTNEITLTAKPTITMPQWPGASKLKGDEKKWWAAMMKALAKHEDGHHKIFDKDAKKFKKDTEAAGDFPKGETAGKMTTFFTSSQGNQNTYDSKTNHGEKEGVTLPV